jgi:cytidylate kinase
MQALHAQVLGQGRGYRSGRTSATKRQATTTTNRGLTIALARQPGTPAADVARAVGTQLGWPVYDRELLERVAQEVNVPVKVLEPLDEQPQSWFLECLQTIAVPARISESRYVHHLTMVIQELADAGRCVIIGRGAAHILPARSTLRVHLVGDLEDRVAAFRAGCGLEWRAAGRRVMELERAWTRFVLDTFHRDPRLPHSYDLVLNTSQWPAARCADVIAQSARSLTATLQTATE